MEDINEELRETIPFDQLAARLGASRDEVGQATELALPALLQGMNATHIDRRMRQPRCSVR